MKLSSEEVNVMGEQGKACRSNDSDMDKEAKYLDKELAVFQSKCQSSA